MTWIVRLTGAAEEDVREAREWYRREAPQVAPAFRREVRQAHRRIADNPRQYPEVYRGVQGARPSVPLCIFYRIQNEAVQVIAITHHARNPDLWMHRV